MKQSIYVLLSILFIYQISVTHSLGARRLLSGDRSVPPTGITHEERRAAVTMIASMKKTGGVFDDDMSKLSQELIWQMRRDKIEANQRCVDSRREDRAYFLGASSERCKFTSLNQITFEPNHI